MEPVDLLFDRQIGHPLIGVLTLSVYREPADHEAGRHFRPATRCAVLLQQSKYAWTDGHTREQALSTLSEMLCECIKDQRELADVRAIIAAPSSRTGFSEELAGYVADRSGLPLHFGADQLPGGRSRKEGARHRDYRVDVELPAERVLLLDDVVNEGVTIRALGLAARQAGALECVGLAVARIAHD